MASGSGHPKPGRSPSIATALGLHHLAFEAPSRKEVDQAAEWLRGHGAEIEGGPGERAYTPGYYAVFFYDPDGIKLEVVHRPRPFSLSFARGLVRGAGSLFGRRARAKNS